MLSTKLIWFVPCFSCNSSIQPVDMTKHIHNQHKEDSKDQNKNLAYLFWSKSAPLGRSHTSVVISKQAVCWWRLIDVRHTRGDPHIALGKSDGDFERYWGTPSCGIRDGPSCWPTSSSLIFSWPYSVSTTWWSISTILSNSVAKPRPSYTLWCDLSSFRTFSWGTCAVKIKFDVNLCTSGYEEKFDKALAGPRWWTKSN